MKPTLQFIELENRVISVKYRCLMIGARVMLVEKISGKLLPHPAAAVASPVPVGSLRIAIPKSCPPGYYFLRALDRRGNTAAQTAEFYID